MVGIQILSPKPIRLFNDLCEPIIFLPSHFKSGVFPVAVREHSTDESIQPSFQPIHLHFSIEAESMGPALTLLDIQHHLTSNQSNSHCVYPFTTTPVSTFIWGFSGEAHATTLNIFISLSWLKEKCGIHLQFITTSINRDFSEVKLAIVLSMSNPPSFL